MGNTHICIDEVDIRNAPLEDLQKIPAKSIWIVLRDPGSGNSEEDLKEKLPGWQIACQPHPPGSENFKNNLRKSQGRWWRWLFWSWK